MVNPRRECEGLDGHRAQHGHDSLPLFASLARSRPSPGPRSWECCCSCRGRSPPSEAIFVFVASRVALREVVDAVAIGVPIAVGRPPRCPTNPSRHPQEHRRACGYSPKNSRTPSESSSPLPSTAKSERLSAAQRLFGGVRCGRRSSQGASLAVLAPEVILQCTTCSTPSRIPGPSFGR
jgi:hypothetical protein